MLPQFKSVLRRPFRLILLVLLLGAVTFGFTTRAVEYLVVTRAVDELSEYYKAIGSLSSDDGDVTQGAKLLSESDLVAINDVQRNCSGTLKGTYNADLDGQTSTKGYNVAEVLLWGNLLEKTCYVERTADGSAQAYYQLRFRVVQRLYGYPDYAPEDGDITVTYIPDEAGTDWGSAFDALQVNTVYGVRAYYSGTGTYTPGLILRQAIPEDEWFLPQGDARMGTLVEADAVQEINRHRVTLTGTKDMSALPFTQEINRDGYLIDGRWLNAADEKSSNPVCVILQDFAEKRGLGVGDTLTITMQDEQMPYSYYPEGTALEDTESSNVTTTFTIVGIFNRTIFSEGYVSASYRSLTIYIPDSCMPAGYDAAVASLQDGTVFENGYSFVLSEPDAQEAFMQQYRSQLESMGYTITMIENGWTEFFASAQPICQSASYSAALFAIVQGMALILVAFLYRRQHRREFAIARALGIPPRKVTLWHLFPVVLLGMAGIGAGSTLAWRYALEQVKVTLSSLVNDGQNVNTGLSGWILVALFALSLALLIMVTLLGYIVLSRHSVMDILHEAQKNQRSQKTPSPSETFTTPTTIPATHSDKPKFDSPSIVISAGKGTSSLVRFMRRHACRSRGTTALVLIVSILLIIALGWIQTAILQTGQKIDELYGNISVEAELLKSVSGGYIGEPGFISGTTVDSIVSTGFVKESNLVAAMTDARLSNVSGHGSMISNFTLCGITSTDDLNQELSSDMIVTGGDGTITFLNGWDDSIFAREYVSVEWYPIVVSETMLEQLGAELDDQLLLSVGSQAVTAVIKGSYTGQFNGLGNLNGDAVLMPLALMKALYQNNLYYSVAEFSLDPALNRNLDAFRTSAEQILENDTKSLLSLNLVIWDEELRMVVQPMEQNLTLMRVLYPIAQAVALLAAGAVALLLLLQEAKTAAMLRILGIPTRTVQRMLGLELLTVGLAGISVGVLIAVGLGKWSTQLPLCAAIYMLGLALGTITGCIVITRRKPLELLQVKE